MVSAPGRDGGPGLMYKGGRLFEALVLRLLLALGF